MYHSQIRLCVKWTYNLHIYIYNIEHRNLEIQNTRNDFSVQVRNFLLSLSLKVLRHKERDIHSFYSGFFLCPRPHLVRHLPKASASKRKSTVSSRGRSQLYSQKSPQILRALPVRDLIRTYLPRFPSRLLWYLWVTRLLRRACAWTPALMLHLSNPCRKVLSLTKPKGIKRNPSANILHLEQCILKKHGG